MEHEQTIDELLKMLEQEEDEKSSPSDVAEVESVNKFIDECDIETGVTRIDNYVIYHKYMSLWKGMSNTRKVNKIVFFRAFNKKFTHGRTNTQRYYLLNADSFDLSREEVTRADIYDKREKSRKKTNKERKREVSLSKKRLKSKE